MEIGKRSGYPVYTSRRRWTSGLRSDQFESELTHKHVARTDNCLIRQAWGLPGRSRSRHAECRRRGRHPHRRLEQLWYQQLP